MKKLLAIAVFVFAVCGLLITSSPHAAQFTFDLNLEFSGGSEPAGTKPWLSATFEDVFTNPGDLLPAAVDLTLSSGGLSAGQYIGGWYFNIDPAYGGILSFNYQGFPGSPGQAGPSASVSQQANSQNADGPRGAGFDLLFSFPVPPADAFDAGESVLYRITGRGASASLFNFLNQPPDGQGEFFSAAQVLGVGGEGFAWIAAAQDKGPGPGPDPIPEPATLLLLGAGLSGLGYINRRSLLKK